MQSYAIWNNKGGTGKSTITFHVASRFAELHPERNVLVIDMCPQANSSMLLLGGGVAGEAKLLSLCSAATPKSVVGYLSDAILNRNTPNLSSYSVQLSTLNNNISPNLYLLSGDGNLELMAPAINDEASRTPSPGLQTHGLGCTKFSNV
jgi:cellulose biosynthesis protein BcsQ